MRAGRRPFSRSRPGSRAIGSIAIVEISNGRVEVEDEVTITTTFTVSPPDRIVHGVDPLVEQRQQRHAVFLLERAGDIAPYLASPNVPKDLVDTLRPIVAARAERFDAASARVDALRTKLRDQVMALRYP